MKARTWSLAAAAVVAVVAAGWTTVRYTTTGRRADVASGYVAHVVCSCRYVGNRDLKSCATDFEPGMEVVRMHDDPQARRITAWVPLLVERTATYSPGFGCALDRR